MIRPVINQVFYCDEHGEAGFDKHCEEARIIGWVQDSSGKNNGS